MAVPRKSLLGRLRDDPRGVSAVEFALLAPVMIAFYFGLAEFCQGYMAQKRMGHVSAVVADLVAQSDTIQSSQMTDMFRIGDLVMQPFSSTPLHQRASSLTRDANGIVKVDWSQGVGMAARNTGSTVVIPDGLIENGESVIMTEATYDYDSPVDYLMPSITRFSQTYYLRPRTVDRITYTN
ncbi:TadE/TadG family type IV pilus assembly protein [Brevundimonas sp.]|uniref:TadE/TadG family type IV pilus assembly protein n=1 Tax=Brevundimonas sp. TaxID=1871086 RepID=UPI003A94A6C1